MQPDGKVYPITNRYIYNSNYNLQSSFTMMTVVSLPSPIKISVGSDNGSIARVKFSLPSTMLSFIIGTLKYTIVVLAENITVYGPET